MKISDLIKEVTKLAEKKYPNKAYNVSSRDFSYIALSILYANNGYQISLNAPAPGQFKQVTKEDLLEPNIVFYGKTLLAALKLAKDNLSK